MELRFYSYLSYWFGKFKYSYARVDEEKTLNSESFFGELILLKQAKQPFSCFSMRLIVIQLFLAEIGAVALNSSEGFWSHAELAQGNLADLLVFWKYPLINSPFHVLMYELSLKRCSCASHITWGMIHRDLTCFQLFDWEITWSFEHKISCVVLF